MKISTMHTTVNDKAVTLDIQKGQQKVNLHYIADLDLQVSDEINPVDFVIAVYML